MVFFLSSSARYSIERRIHSGMTLVTLVERWSVAEIVRLLHRHIVFASFRIRYSGGREVICICLLSSQTYTIGQRARRQNETMLCISHRHTLSVLSARIYFDCMPFLFRKYQSIEQRARQTNIDAHRDSARALVTMMRDRPKDAVAGAHRS